MMRFIIVSVTSIIAILNIYWAIDTKSVIELETSNVELLAEGDGVDRGFFYNFFHGTMWVANGDTSESCSQTFVWWECQSQAFRMDTCTETHITVEPYGLNPNDRYSWFWD